MLGTTRKWRLLRSSRATPELASGVAEDTKLLSKLGAARRRPDKRIHRVRTSALAPAAACARRQPTGRTRSSPR